MMTFFRRGSGDAAISDHISASLPIALDAMGGDFAPAEQVAGAVAAARARGLPILLVGRKGPLEAQLRLHKTAGLAD